MGELESYAGRALRLRQWMESKSPVLTQADVGRRAGKTRAYISALLGQTRPFGERIARDLERSLHMPKGFLDQGEDPGLEAVTTWNTPGDLAPGVYAMVPRVSIRLSAGGGALVEREEDLPPLAFREDWLRKKNITSKSALRICEVSGDSMSPYLENGDCVMIDTGQTEVRDLSVYAIRYGEELRIKRLSRRFDGGLIIRSDNQRYPEEQINATDASHIQILGLVIWRAG